MALPRHGPFLVWLVVLVADVAVVVWTIRRLDRRATRHSVAAAIEREQLAARRLAARRASKWRNPARLAGAPPRR